MMKTELSTSAVITSEQMLEHWQGHRNLTRRVIEAFPEDKLFTHSIGDMRTFGEISKELIDLAGRGIHGIATGNWDALPDLDHQTETASIATVHSKQELLRLWDMVTGEINSLWPTIPEGRFSEVDVAFGLYEGEIKSTLFYFIDNEIHHRGQGYVYLRSLGIEPPSFWEK
ncbi:MAG: DinB family protein [Balneolaceae bacterium]